MRTARSRISGENLFVLVMALFSQELVPTQNPGRFSEFVSDDLRSRQITAFHVLTHTSGLPNIVRDGTPLRTYFNPGERFSYGSSAFAWLQLAIEAKSGRRLEALAREHVFDPLGMRRSSLEWQARFTENHAQGSEWDGGPVQKRLVRTAQASWSLLTTASDYIGFVQHVLARGGLAAATYDQWLLPRVLTRQGDDAEDLNGDNPQDPNVAWGLGWGLEPSQNSFSIGEIALGSAHSSSPIAKHRMRLSGLRTQHAASDWRTPSYQSGYSGRS